MRKNSLLSRIVFVNKKTFSNVCPHCGKNCMSKAVLKKHVRIVHENIHKNVKTVKNLVKGFD